MDVRNLLRRAVCFMLGVLLCCPPNLNAEDDDPVDARPNILFILADDLGFGDLACYGNSILETPCIDSLAEQGVRLTNHYAPSPLCAPSRAGYLTGRFNHRTGAVDVPSNRGLDRIELSEKTFGDHFQNAGYRTSLIGKWHNGIYCNDYLPHHRGFDEFIGFAGGGQDYWQWNLLQNDGAFPRDDRYLTDVLNDETCRFISEAAASDVPFALFLAHHAPHPPLQAPQSLIKKYERKIGGQSQNAVATMYAMIEQMDRGLGRVFDQLRSLGIWHNTIVVFTSDNGAYLGRIGGQSTERFHAGLSGNKGDVGEQGIRVPAIVVWQNHLPAGTVLQTPVHGCDWLPTLLDASGGTFADDSKPIDGQNVWEALAGRPCRELDGRALMFQKNRYHPVAYSDAAIRLGDWKLVWPGIAETMKKQSARDNPSYLRSIVKPHWQMPMDRGLKFPGAMSAPRPRLFHLPTDSGESNDVAESNRERVELMSRLYGDWYDDVIQDWNQARRRIVLHDRAYWKERQPPDPEELYRSFWLWNKVPPEDRSDRSKPLRVFRGYWSENESR